MNVCMGTGTGTESGSETGFGRKIRAKQMRDALILIFGLLYGTLGTLVLVGWKWPPFEAFCPTNTQHEIVVEKAAPDAEIDPIIHRITRSQAFEIQLDPK